MPTNSTLPLPHKATPEQTGSYFLAIKMYERVYNEVTLLYNRPGTGYICESTAVDVKTSDGYTCLLVSTFLI